MAAMGIGVDGGSRNAKIIQGRDKSGEFQILSVGLVKRDLGKDGTASDDVADAIREVIAAAAPKKAATVLGLTGRDLMLRYSQTPALPAHRLKVLMDFEVQEIAEKIEGEVAADYNILPGEVGDGGEQMALIAMAKESYVAPRIDAVLGSLPVRYATPNMLAVTNAFLRFGGFQEGETTLHLDIGHENADLGMQRDGDLLFARNLNFGGKTFTDALVGHFGLDFAKAEELKRTKGRVPVRGEGSFPDGLTEKTARALQGVLGQLVGLVQSSISFCKVQWKQQDMKIGRVLLSGEASLLPGLPKALSENLGITVELFDPLDRLDLSQLDPDEESLLRKRPQAFAVAIGLALMAADPRFFSVQVLPSRLRKKKELRERTAFLVAAGVLAIAYLGISAFIGKKQLAAAETRHSSLSRQESDRRRDETKYEAYLEENRERFERLQLLDRQLAPGYALARTIEAVQRQMSAGEGLEGLWISSIELREQKKSKDTDLPPLVIVQGSGVETGEDVSRVANRFAAALKKDLSDNFGARATNSFNRRQATFEIEIDFTPAADAAGEGEEGDTRE